MTTARPTVYLTNFASRSAPHRGPGRVWSIMAKPRRWEHGEGSVWRLTPRPTDLDAVRSGAMHIDEYRRRFKIDVLARPLCTGEGIYSPQGVPMTLADPKGGDMAEWPADLRVRQWPAQVPRVERVGRGAYRATPHAGSE